MPHNLHRIFTSLEGIYPLTYEALSSMRPCAVFRIHSTVEMGRYTYTVMCCLTHALCHSFWIYQGKQTGLTSSSTGRCLGLRQLLKAPNGTAHFNDDAEARQSWCQRLFLSSVLHADVEHLQGALAGQSRHMQIS